MNPSEKIIGLAIMVLGLHLGVSGYFQSLYNGIAGKCSGCKHE